MRNTEFDIAILMMWCNKKLFVDNKNEGDSNSELPQKKDVHEKREKAYAETGMIKLMKLKMAVVLTSVRQSNCEAPMPCLNNKRRFPRLSLLVSSRRFGVFDISPSVAMCADTCGRSL